MAVTRTNIATVDPVWDRIRDEPQKSIDIEPRLGGLMHASILSQPRLQDSLAYRMSIKLESRELSEQSIRAVADEAFAKDS